MAQQKCEVPDFDYVQLVIYNVHGQAVGRMVSRKRFEKDVGGVINGIYGAVCFFGIDGSVNIHPDFGETFGFPNIYMRPILDTLTPSHEGKGRVGHMICDLETLDGTKIQMAPRATAERQLARLADLGYTLRSTFEIEFDVFKGDDVNTPFAHLNKWANVQVLDVNQDILLELVDNLKTVGVNVDTLMSEYGPGMFELTFDIMEGIKCADAAARFKAVAKAFFEKRGLTASFMSKPDPVLTGSGMHYNHSIWKDGKNAMVDESMEHNLSKVGRHWLAGLVKHGAAITVLCSPTITCFRRIGAPWAPGRSDWGLHDRCKSFRLKSESSNVYIENRVVSASCNPYMVIAGCVAAGLDGVVNELELPDASTPQPPLPRDLESGLCHLEADTVIVQALGHDLVKHFAYAKRQFELEPYKEATSKSDVEKLKLEKQLYFHNA